MNEINKVTEAKVKPEKTEKPDKKVKFARTHQLVLIPTRREMEECYKQEAKMEQKKVHFSKQKVIIPSLPKVSNRQFWYTPEEIDCFKKDVFRGLLHHYNNKHYPV